MTQRLYYDDAYLTEFDATVTECREADGKTIVRLDRSAFYPTSGGQPYDTGTLGDARVLDVYVGEDHDVYHVTDRPLAVGATVRGHIDWPRRFDHMQQHAGDHMIASALWRHLGGVTIGLHLGEAVSTIDVDMPGGATHLSPEEIRMIERDVNERIQRDVPVRCWFPSPDELEELPLRKKPTVKEHVRVVAIGSDEMVACGGTHPATAGQLGLLKIVGAAPARGKLRVSFLAGMRALGDYQAKYDVAQQTAGLLSTAVENLPAHVSAMQEALREAEFALNRLRREAALNAIAAEPPTVRPDGVRVVARMLEGDVNLIKDVASRLIKKPGTAALLGAEVEAGRAVFVFARSQDVDIHMGRLLSDAAKPLGGKGGGRPDFAQGGGVTEILERARDALVRG
ncbi:MAG: hypothetical protein IKE76_16850 [Clostridia bacterium]|nr:hypothetical protein [Clostridia bacterium]